MGKRGRWGRGVGGEEGLVGKRGRKRGRGKRGRWGRGVGGEEG